MKRAPGLLLALGVQSCVFGPSCLDVVDLATTRVGLGLNVSGYEGYPCTVTFASGSAKVTTTLEPTAPPATNPAPASPTQKDAAACMTIESTDTRACTTSAGTTPLCRRSTTCLYVKLREVKDYDALGPGETYDVRVECGGVTRLALTNVPRTVQQCAY